MGLALLEAGMVLEDERMVAAGARAFAYEESVFDADEGNWPEALVIVLNTNWFTGSYSPCS
jgi:hypothetical protein